MRRRQKLAEMTVQAKDTYDPAKHITVHQDYFNGMVAAIRQAHGEKCICIYCRRHSNRAVPLNEGDAGG